MSEIKTYAEYYLYGLMENFVRAEEVITWADSTIILEEHPAGEMIDLSLCQVSDVHEVMRCLRAIRGELDHKLHFQLLIRFYSSRYSLQKKLSRAAGDLWQLTHHEAATSEFRADAARVDELADYVSEGLRPELDLHLLICDVFKRYTN